MSSKKTATKKQQITDTKNKAAIEKASNLKVDQALNAINKASLEVQATFSGVSAGLIEKAAELTAVEQAIALKKSDLEVLHGADKLLLTIDELRAEHQKVVDQVAADTEKLRAEFEEVQKAEEVRRDREAADYRYQLDQDRKRDNDTWQEQLRVRHRDELIRQEKFDKDFIERAAALQAKETEYQTALSKLATFEAEVNSKVAREVAIATASQKKEFEHRIELTAVQHKAEVDRFQSDNKRLIESANNLEAQVKDLQEQLKAAYAKNADLAAKAVDGATTAKAQADALSLMTNIGSGNGSRPRS